MDWQCLPAGTSDLEKDQLTLLLHSLQGYLRVCNPYIQDFLLALEIPANQVDQGHLVINADARSADVHEHRYNHLQGLLEVAILMGDEPGVRDKTLLLHGGGLQSVHDTHLSFDALHYLFFFPDGDDSWNLSLTLSTGKCMSACDFYAFHLHQRNTERDTLLQGFCLFQEYVCMAFAKVENMRLQFLASNQSAIHADLYQNIVDTAAASDSDQSVGQRVILPATFTGSPHDMHHHYQDAMATV